MSIDLKKVIKIVKEMTIAEINARLGSPVFDASWHLYVEKKDELQEYLFGTSDYLKLGIQWGILEENKEKKKQYSEEDLEL